GRQLHGAVLPVLPREPAHAVGLLTPLQRGAPQGLVGRQARASREGRTGGSAEPRRQSLARRLTTAPSKYRSGFSLDATLAGRSLPRASRGTPRSEQVRGAR